MGRCLQQDRLCTAQALANRAASSTKVVAKQVLHAPSAICVTVAKRRDGSVRNVKRFEMPTVKTLFLQLLQGVARERETYDPLLVDLFTILAQMPQACSF